MTPKDHVDVLIIGGGQAGIPLAWKLAAQGRQVALVERERLGGSCINFGCTPTKAAIASARVAHQARRGAEYGLYIPEVRVDFAAVLKRARGVAAASREGLDKGFEGSANPFLLRGQARLDGRTDAGFRVKIGEQTLVAKELVLNTGTRSLIPELEGLEKVDRLHAGNWMDRPELPEHLLLLGGGYIALEMGQFYRRMGSKITIVERGERILAREDPDVVATLQKLLEAEGIAFRTNTTVERVEAKEGVTLHTRHNERAGKLTGSHLFIAIGRKPNTDDLGLETVGVLQDEHGYVKVDARLATNVEGIWAAGDIRGGPQFTHTSWDDHRILLSQMTGDQSRTTHRHVPYAVFTDPELGRIGLTAAEAHKSGKKIKTARFDMAKNGKASELGETEGFIQVIVDADTDQLLGATLLCTEASELVHIYIDLINANAPYTVLRDAIHIHPTLAEAVQSAVAALDEAQ
ncbi:MAG: Pyruvate/2-oxoglutarate dehydrogenase complex dihydrolipoamide dehydrogenase component [Chthonomonadaceae bacterium]|nr:Pyruvate/2-oxoglutarate dehydrogenase complex dihydrolipoamide dehydrogenase component [Chthonomonadaceae bacterium]